MHRALHLLYSQAGRSGALGLLPPEPVFRPCPEAGLAAEGADEAMSALVRIGLLHERGAGVGATLVVDEAALISRRRSLMTRDPSAVALLQRAGERWAALASTAANIVATPTSSVASSVASSTA